LGFICAALTDRGICALYLLDADDPAPALARLRADHPATTLVEDQAAVAALLPRVAAYVTEGKDVDWPLDAPGTTFQKRVWDALRTIPWGETRTYGELARAIGVSGGARAVGAACGANPISLLVPCHRVVASGGALGGYYWGPDRKRALLEMERRGHTRSSSAP
jgi:O-6-methylguanine DNA methyltransferase